LRRAAGILGLRLRGLRVACAWHEGGLSRSLARKTCYFA
jgi:hypothetical protein